MIIHESTGKCEGRRVFLKQNFPLVVHRVRQTENHSALKSKNHSAVIRDSWDQTEWLSYIHTGHLHQMNQVWAHLHLHMFFFFFVQSVCVCLWVGGWQGGAGSGECLCWNMKVTREENQGLKNLEKCCVPSNIVIGDYYLDKDMSTLGRLQRGCHVEHFKRHIVG